MTLCSTLIQALDFSKPRFSYLQNDSLSGLAFPELPASCGLLLRLGGLPALGPHLRACTGNSGIGRYHGKFSFDTFSHHRASLLSSSGLEKLNELHYPPYTAHSQKLITWVLGSHRCALL